MANTSECSATSRNYEQSSLCVGYVASLSRSVWSVRASSRRFCANYAASMRAENRILDEFVNISGLGVVVRHVTGNIAIRGLFGLTVEGEERWSERERERENHLEGKLETRQGITRIQRTWKFSGEFCIHSNHSFSSLPFLIPVLDCRCSVHLWIFFTRAKLLFTASTCRVFSGRLFIQGRLFPTRFLSLPPYLFLWNISSANKDGSLSQVMK